MSKYEPVIGKDYLKEIYDNRRHLSLKIQNEFIHILGNHVKKNILDRIRKANYSAIIIDCTSDISNTDLISFICRYVDVAYQEMEVRELFLGFITNHGKTAYDIRKIILDRLEKEKVYFKKCRGLVFDNAASMAVVHGNIQHLLRNINGKPKFVPCSNHS